MNLKLLGCDALRRELFALAALSPHELDLTLLPCDVSPDQLQREVDGAKQADYILLALGERACIGLRATSCTLVVPRAHDCAHLLMGDTGRYARAFSESDDDPNWLFPRCLQRDRGTPCAVFSPFFPTPLPLLPEGAREYTADLALLRDLLFGRWDGRFVLVEPGEQITVDPLDILAAEPV
jgi:hypothetical protein